MTSWIKKIFSWKTTKKQGITIIIIISEKELVRERAGKRENWLAFYKLQNINIIICLINFDTGHYLRNAQWEMHCFDWLSNVDRIYTTTSNKNAVDNVHDGQIDLQFRFKFKIISNFCSYLNTDPCSSFYYSVFVQPFWHQLGTIDFFLAVSYIFMAETVFKTGKTFCHLFFCAFIFCFFEFSVYYTWFRLFVFLKNGGQFFTLLFCI